VNSGIIVDYMSDFQIIDNNSDFIYNRHMTTE